MYLLINVNILWKPGWRLRPIGGYLWLEGVIIVQIRSKVKIEVNRFEIHLKGRMAKIFDELYC